MAQINMDNKIEVWQNKLLDLGKRNRLLNFRETKRSNLKIISPGCFSLWDSFVQEEKPLLFPYYDGNSDDDDEDNFAYPIQTNQSVKEMQRTLKVLRDRAKTTTEEQGVNILYLSFGFIKWTESSDSDNWLTSPILLVPASLTVESITSPYILSLHEDEIIINPTLSYKFENDFGITLPKYNENDSLESLFAKINKMISPNKWEVIVDTSLSLLSFLKINMYNDLKKHKDAIISNPIVRTISGDASASNKIPEEILDFDHDNKLTPSELFQVVDADSSQQDAILCAKKGISFVLQGPPGTGKSQTITNIIAECLADGKKVLFVSEKMAALDVVHRRLTGAGLNEFCLILHSYKANKRSVLEQLGTTLSLAQKRATLSDEAYQKLDLLQSDKNKLNEYAKQIFETVQPLGKSIYEVNGILSHLESYDEVIFTMDKIAAVSGRQYNRYNYLLNQFYNTIGKMSDDYKKNPWYGSSVPAVTNELRHDIGARLGKLIPKIENANNELTTLFNDLSLEWSTSYSAMLQLVPVLENAEQAHIIPMSWIFGNDIEPLFDEVSSCEELKSHFKEKQQQLSAQYRIIVDNDESLSLSSYSSLVDINSVLGEIETLTAYITSGSPYKNWADKMAGAVELFKEAKDKSAQINELVSQISSEFESTIYDIDYNDIYSRYKTEYTSFLKVFKSSYKADKKKMQLQYKAIIKNVSDEMVLSVIGKLRTLEEIKKWFADNKNTLENYFGDLLLNEKADFVKLKKHFDAYSALRSSVEILDDMSQSVNRISETENNLIAHYQFLYKGIDTEWADVSNALTWALSFRKQVEQNNLNKAFAEAVCSNTEIASKCGATAGKITEIKNNLDIELQWYINLFDAPDNITALSMPALQDKLIKCTNGLSLLEEWIDFRTARANCCDEGLFDYINRIDELHIDAGHIIPVFKKRFFRLWLDAVLPQYPAVLNFRSRVHEDAIREFVALDKMQFEIAKARIRSKLINDLPSLERFTSGVDEISTLKRELGKQRRIMPIRRLFREIPNLLLTLKPCLMMSPLSVSLFLEAETYKFDTIIFDEASQVCTENAIGAISRGKQVIIAGDSKQLPPTNFFTASTSSDGDFDTDDDEYDDTEAYESILDEAGLLPERTLLWHYRSRHEHLIAFSNTKIYKNNLITFPANIDKIADNGVEYIFVNDGYYDRGGKKGNMIEAKKVAGIVFEHINKHPNRTLGIIAFGEIQQLAIDTAIREMRLKNQQYEYFFKEDKDEPFFIKNLENVQGDERDTIIFSIGYAKDAAGVFRMNFGPLSKSGGERRLNVAITRAKYNVKLVGSIMPHDIVVERISADGPKLLRAYIDFAINGVESLIRETSESDNVEHDSPFEASVYNYLDRKGYKVVTQVGCSGYRIDMAIKHPTISGKYILGVECDGAAYHSARTARERDRLRQEVLESMGWKIHRIWSTDWIKDPITEGEKLIAVIEDTIANYGIIETKESSSNVDLGDSSFVSVNKKEISDDERLNPYNFQPLKHTSFSNLPRNNYGYLEISDCILTAVQNEYPLHYELLCQKLAHLYGNEKATVKIRREVDYGLNKLGNKILRKDDFLFPMGYSSITVRTPNIRKINHISVEELAEAMYVILKNSVGSTREGLCVEATRVYGWQRMTQGIGASMNTACDFLISQKRAKELEGKIVLIQTEG